MSLNAFLPANVAKHPNLFIGPNILSALVQGVEVGVLINQSLRFWARGSQETRLVKYLVAFATMAAVLQTTISWYDTWQITVVNYGNWYEAVNLKWPQRIQPLLNGLMAAPVQAFLIARCYSATKRKLYILVPLVALLLSTIATNILITYKLVTLNAIDTFLHPPKHLPYEFVSAFVLTSALDVIITVIMLWFLLSVKTHAVSSHAEMIISRLLRTMWEAAAPPCICAILAMALYISSSSKNLWCTFFQFILGKLYVISLFAILNGRIEVKKMRQSFITPLSNSRGTRSRLTEIHVQMTTVTHQDPEPTTAKSVTWQDKEAAFETAEKLTPTSPADDSRCRPWEENV